MNYRIRSWYYVLCLVLFFIASIAIAEETRKNTYPLPNHGSIQFNVQSNWQDDLLTDSNGLPPTIKFTQKSGSPFKILVTPIWAANEYTQLPDGNKLRNTVQSMADKVKSQAIEKNIELKELVSSSAHGYYFSLTDSAPKPGEFKYLTQGSIRVGDLIATFTILTNDGQDRFISDGLALMKSAEQIKDSATSKIDAIEISELEKVFRVAVPISKLIMTIPRSGLSIAKNQFGGSANHPRYFYFRDASSKLEISGWFEPSNLYPGEEKYFGELTKVWKANGLPVPENVKLLKRNDWVVTSYDMPYRNCYTPNIQAHFVKDNTWINLHISYECGSGKKMDDLINYLDTIKIISKDEQKVDVYLIPLDDFPSGYAVNLSRELSKDLSIYVKSTLEMGTSGLKPFEGIDQYPAEDIVDMSSTVIENLPEKEPNTVFIILTRRDINERARNFRFLFAWHQKAKRVSVVSAARMLGEINGEAASPEKIFSRIYKMTKRSIGEQYYRYSRSSDIRDVMYSPIMNLDNLDNMGTKYLQKNNP
ncbi:MAG: hypothetical protein NTW65_01145 [Deltaproteobacteria bacterium]|nr:hypothetical protein [Deltaproteobacteria bacterium]